MRCVVDLLEDIKCNSCLSKRLYLFVGAGDCQGHNSRPQKRLQLCLTDSIVYSPQLPLHNFASLETCLFLFEGESLTVSIRIRSEQICNLHSDDEPDRAQVGQSSTPSSKWWGTLQGTFVHYAVII
jgi:hypothetical protein